MQDSYGDGWQGSKITVNIDGTPVEVSMISSYDGGPPCCTWNNDSDTVTIPEGTVSATWSFTGGSYPSEVTFQVYGPDGQLLGDFGPSPSPGLLPITLCAQ
ncbi:MAG: hypothetical protein R3213_03485, partial [Flavobacteriaceae bacterium]|nr:hypothetical protein [Flavobacteriaceae bacterium]